MKFKITEKGNTVTLNVKLSQSEIKNEDTVNYGWRKAKEKLKQEGYDLGRMIEYTTLMNKFSVYEGDFIFVFEPVKVTKQKTVPIEIKTVEVNLDKVETVPTLKEEKISSPYATSKVKPSTRRTSKKKK
jgi:hypothetical protein